ncbi:MAG: amino acid adenylation domain-containing protein, partial [Methylococcales bacterium]|nr:amino acid adenylation domain-containing protein [Methylococcales bacterium]
AQQILVEWNQTQQPISIQQTLHHLVAEKAKQTPAKLAVYFEGKQLNYQELEQQSNQLARYIAKMGAELGQLVGICLPRSVNMIISILAVLKTGAAYVPLDPEYPQDRLDYMLEDAQITIILTEENLQERMTQRQSTVVLINKEMPLIQLEKTKELSVSTDGNTLAYVIYTSGSTGKPKGVCCHHLGVINLLEDFTNRKPIKAGQNASFWTSFNFDVSVYEIFSPLVVGACLVIVPERVRSDGQAFVQWLHEESIQNAYVPPFMLSQLSNWIKENPGESELSRLLVGVEPIAESLLVEMMQQVADLQIINGYGPTEATICSTLYSVGNESAAHFNTPIGSAVQNTRCYVLDQQKQAVPIGVSGELYIGGIALAKGYLNQPMLTEEKFIDNPFCDSSVNNGNSEKLYKTGDLVRYLDNGCLEFVGRSDYQVKLRGYRIELGEIESLLLAQDVILESVVLVREDVVNDKRLVAYVVVKDKQLFHGSTIRQQLREKLPDYMLPGHFVVLEKMPITVNGKIDRHVLPMPMYDEINDQQEFVAARSEMELRLSRIWCDVLSIDKTGVFNNFFELGGHSLLATQVISKINSELSVDVPLRQIFETPTIEALAKSLEKISQIDVETNIVPLIAVPREQAHPLSFAQQRLWILDQLDPANPAYNISGAVRLQGALDQDALEQALGDVIKRHEPLRTSFVEEEGEVLQKINAYRGFLLPVRILTGKDLKQKEQQARKIAGEEAQWGFDLSRGPLFRARLLCLSESDHILLMNMHHIISDGWSMQI